MKRTSMIPFAGTAAVAALVVLTPSLAWSHGSMEVPLSRNYRCFKEGPESLDTAACRASSAAVGSNAFHYDWNGYNQNPNGNHQAFVPDGQLCGAGRPQFSGMNLGRTDWVATNVAAGANVNFTYHATAPHATSYHRMYVTRAGYSLTSPLRWADLQQICQINGTRPLNNFRYNFACQMPAGRSGRAILYHVWQRSDSPEAFYACIDVNFGGTGPTPTPTPTTNPTPTPTPTPTTNPTPTPTPGGTWRLGGTYAVGQVVTYNGASYRCLQAHTAHSEGWNPVAAPALWQRI